jgi:hypothetical protein
MDRRPVLFVLGAAILYGVGLPLSKVLQRPAAGFDILAVGPGSRSEEGTS